MSWIDYHKCYWEPFHLENINQFNALAWLYQFKCLRFFGFCLKQSKSRLQIEKERGSKIRAKVTSCERDTKINSIHVNELKIKN